MADTVPTQTSASQGQQQTAAGSVDILSQLVSSAREADERAAQATKVASVPVAGGHQQPQNVNLPGAGRQYKQFDLDTSPVVGKHNANMQGIANLTKSIANVVGQVQQQRDIKKTQQLSVNIEHLMGAINSADQAKQVLAQDPNNAAAKEQLDKANKIAGEVLDDDKNRKAIGKAFNINFVDPSKNNTPEHAALKQATDSYAKQFQDKLPQNMAPNQAAIAAAQTATAEAKATHDLVNKIAPAIIAAQSREQVAQTTAEAKVTAQREHDKATFNTATAVAQKRYEAVMGSANIHARAMYQSAHERTQAMIQIAQDKIDQLNGVNGKSPKAQQEAQKAFDSISKTLMGYQQNINLLEQNRKNADPKAVKGYDDQIRFLEDEGKVLQLKQKELASRLSDAGDLPTLGTPMSESSPTTSDGQDGANAGYIDNPGDDSADDGAGEGYDK